jgi:hypothetical protein
MSDADSLRRPITPIGGNPEIGAAPRPTLVMTEVAPMVKKIGCRVAAKDRWFQPVACA